MGVCTLAALEFESDDFSLEAGNKFGGALTAGFEAKKFRMGFEYNFIPKAKVETLIKGTDNKIRNSYLAVTVGFYLGGGTWKK